MSENHDERMSVVESKVDRILNLLLKFFTSSEEPAAPPPKLTKPQVSEYERELRAIQRNMRFLASQEPYSYGPTDTLHTADGRQVPVRRRGRAVWLS